MVQFSVECRGYTSCSVNGKKEEMHSYTRTNISTQSANLHAKQVMLMLHLTQEHHQNPPLRQQKEPQQMVLIWFFFYSISGCSSGAFRVGLRGGGEEPSSV